MASPISDPEKVAVPESQKVPEPPKVVVPDTSASSKPRPGPAPTLNSNLSISVPSSPASRPSAPAHPEKLAPLALIPTHTSIAEFPAGLYPSESRKTAPPPRSKEDDDGDSTPVSPTTPVDEFEMYNRFPRSRKLIISILMGWCGLISPISSTAVAAALPEVAADYGTTGTIISLSNALYLFVMGISPPFWGPLSQIYGRRVTAIAVLISVIICSMGTALSPDLGAFFFFRLSTAFCATALLVLGSSVIGDLYHPTQRATGLSYYMIGPLLGPSLGPFMGSVVITYSAWTTIYWVQAGMAALGLVGVVLIVPETLVSLRKDALEGMPVRQKAKTLGMWTLANPVKMVKLLRYPNLMCMALAAAGLAWNQYGLLTPIRYVLNPRFHLTKPIQSGILFLAFGVGALSGSTVGSRWADHVVRKWVRKRNGVRVPEDRLRSYLVFAIVLAPCFQLVYGWSVMERVGGMPVPVIFMFLQGWVQMMCYPSIDTYLLDVNQERAAETIGGNYMGRYWAAGVASAVALPMIDSVGVGWYTTVSAGIVFLGGLASAMTAYWGAGWRERLDERIRQREIQAAGGAAEVRS